MIQFGSKKDLSLRSLICVPEIVKHGPSYLIKFLDDKAFLLNLRIFQNLRKKTTNSHSQRKRNIPELLMSSFTKKRITKYYFSRFFNLLEEGLSV